MTNIDEYKAKLDSLNFFKTFQEKNALISSLSDGSSVDIAKILGFETESETEAIAVIYKLREISVSDIIEITNECSNCNYQDIHMVSIPGMFFQDDSINKSVPIGLFDGVEKIPEIELDRIINNKNVSEYDELDALVIENNTKIFNPKIKITCKKCETVLETQVAIKDVISNFSIKNIYEQYLDITTYTSMTKLDVDDMFPFEREIFLGLIQTKEDAKT